MKYLQSFLFVFFLFLFIGCTEDMSEDLQKETVIFNNLNQSIYQEEDIDSVKSYLIKYDELDYTNLREFWVHNSFAQSIFIVDSVSEYNKKVLKLLSEDNFRTFPNLINSLEIYYRAVNSDITPEIIKQYNKELVFSKESLSERYRILLFKLLPIGQNEYLLDEVIKNSNTYLISLKEGEKIRGLYRYLIAHSYYLKAELAKKKNNKYEEKLFFEEASKFSPDKIDLKDPHIYFYDLHFLNGKEDYTNQYTELLLSEGDSTKAFTVLSSKALFNFNYFVKAKNIFQKLYPDSSFIGYWNIALSNELPQIPKFSLTTIDNKIVDSDNFKGKWIMLDFWGTWCQPCRKELPKIQNLSDELNSENDGIAEVITIACKDNPNQINKLIKEKNYDFVIALSDNKIEQEFGVKSFPTKFLITPNGNYFQLYSNVDWELVVKTYLLGD